MATFYVIATQIFVILVLTSSPCDAWKKDIKVRYFSSTILPCQENRTVIPDTSQIFWITPDATVLTSTTPEKDFPQNVKLAQNNLITQLNITEVSDSQFGFYTCVMVKTNSEVVLARWGLNVDGADFSHLEEEYRKNAVVGAIAAGVMIALLGGTCLIWHFRYTKRSRPGESAENGGVKDDLGKPATSNVFHNQGYDEPLPRVVVAEVQEEQEQEEESARRKTDGPAGESEENGVAASCKM